MALIMGAAGGDGNVPQGVLLCALAEAVARWQWDDVAKLRNEGAAGMAPRQLSDAILVAAGFNGITRIADAIGIRLDASTAETSTALRAETGIDGFAPARKWAAG